jgi:hypothetical protein
MTKQRYAKFWSRRSIVSLIGIDYPILEESGHDNIRKFYIAGALVLAILAISFCAVFYAFDLMFDMWHAEILLSSFFSLMFFIIYIFLIQTFSKEVFPTTYKIKFLNLSNLSRIGFVLMIGFLIAQPIKIFVYRHQLENDISDYKGNLYQKFEKINANLYATDLNKLINSKTIYLSMPKSATLSSEIDKIDRTINDINNQISLANNKTQTNILTSNFFIKRIELAGHYPFSPVVVILVLSLFFTPIALIYSISGKSKYYNLKKKHDKELVINNYLNFKNKYTHLFERKYELENIPFHEPFIDPPFNTERKPFPNYLSQEDFFNNLFE